MFLDVPGVVSVPKADDCQTGPLHIVSSSVRDPPVRILGYVGTVGRDFPEKDIEQLEIKPLGSTLYTLIIHGNP